MCLSSSGSNQYSLLRRRTCNKSKDQVSPRSPASIELAMKASIPSVAIASMRAMEGLVNRGSKP